MRTDEWHNNGEPADSKQRFNAVQIVDETVRVWNEKLWPNLEANGTEFLL